MHLISNPVTLKSPLENGQLGAEVISYCLGLKHYFLELEVIRQQYIINVFCILSYCRTTISNAVSSLLTLLKHGVCQTTLFSMKESLLLPRQVVELHHLPVLPVQPIELDISVSRL